MNETLKGVAHIGAQLAAAKADLQREMERHRKTWRQLEQVTGLLREAVDLKNHHSITDLADPVRVRIEAALSHQVEPKCCAPTEEELQLLNSGEYRPEELWGGSAPTCPKCAEPAPAQDEPLDQRMLEQFTCRREDDAGGTPGLTIYFTKLFQPHEYQLYRNEAAALHANLGAALGIARPAQSEPAQAQDELIPRNQAIAEAFREGVEWQRNRPAQTEQKPVAMVDANDDGMWADILPDVTVKVGQMLYAAPIAQTAPQVPERLPVEPYQTVDRSSTNYKAGWNACRKAMLEGQAAPQPEQSGFSPELLQRVMSALNQGATSFKTIKAVRDEFRAALSAVTAERDRLQASEVSLAKDLGEALRQQCADMRTIDQLRAEVGALKADAERYRWTSIEGNWVARAFGKWRAHTGDAQRTEWFPSRGEAIDAAMAAKEA